LRLGVVELRNTYSSNIYNLTRARSPPPTSQMLSHTNVEEKHLNSNKSTSQEEEEYSRSSSSVHDVVHQHEEPDGNKQLPRDKEAQDDARSTLTTRSVIPPPPDGGLHAWLKVFGGFMIYINIWCVNPHQHMITKAKTDDTFSQGVYFDLRRFSILLRNNTPLFLVSQRYILDRHRASLAPHRHRRFIRSAFRPRVLSVDVAGWQFLSSTGHHDVEFEYEVLAGLSESGGVYGCWSGVTLYSQPSDGGGVV
jgi:hypothetical protein